MPNEAAFFDLDKTLLPGSSLFPLAREMYRQRFFDLHDIARLTHDQLAFQLSGKEAQSRMERAREATLQAIAGRRRDEMIEAGRGVVQREIVPRLYPQAVELVARHKRAGRLVYICSSSPQDVLQLLAEAIDADGVIGTLGEIDENGVYTGGLDGPMVHGPEKAARVERLAKENGIALERSYAYSDSINDLPLLELVGNPVALNPDYRLLQVARKRGWQVIDFRTARRRTLLASAVGGGAAAVGAAGYALGYLIGRRTGAQRAELA